MSNGHQAFFNQNFPDSGCVIASRCVTCPAPCCIEDVPVRERQAWIAAQRKERKQQEREALRSAMVLPPSREYRR